MNRDRVTELFGLILTEGLGLDLNDPNLSATPNRVAKMFCNEFFTTLGKEIDGITVFPNIYGYNQLIISPEIKFTSYCAHHFLPFYGSCWVIYLPSATLIGASKPARIVDHYSHRPQLQEHLTHEIMQCFVRFTKPRGAMVFMKAVHQCMSCRGVMQRDGMGMITSAVHGEFLEDADLKMEALSLLKV